MIQDQNTATPSASSILATAMVDGVSDDSIRIAELALRGIGLSPRMENLTPREVIEAALQVKIPDDKFDVITMALRGAGFQIVSLPPNILKQSGTTYVDNRGLSVREVQMVRLLITGLSNKGIAGQLGITEATVKVHLKSLLRKIACSNRTQAAIWGMNNGLTPAS